MLDTPYDSYGYKFNDNFVTFSDRKNLKYPAPKNVTETLSEVDSFFEQTGPNVIDLVSPELGQEF